MYKPSGHCGVGEWVSGASEQANECVRGLVLPSGLLIVLDHVHSEELNFPRKKKKKKKKKKKNKKKKEVVKEEEEEEDNDDDKEKRKRRRRRRRKITMTN